MDFKPTTVEAQIAWTREILATGLLQQSPDESTFEVLHALTVKAALVREPSVFAADIYELLDGIFGSAVILCAGKGFNISTKNNTSGFWKIDKSCAQLLIFELIRTACHSCLDCENVLVTSKTSFGSLIVTASLNSLECDIGLLERLAKKLGGRVQIVFHHNLKTLAVYLPIKKSGSKNLSPEKQAYEYLMDPYSPAYISLFDVCNNPLLNAD